ncbi:MAG: hypothetical protein COZ06_12570 [Armatimonadetes bacterium CG_4_10_14_3_um_filter_66_18]|nr:CCA tRNA nucleotidyltransferase [Armatimonadota bacterium]OIP05748.1 MAG: hypothetical protein AUJ96_10135 [Armatimonadetes bacterium CG2_30_66_41]PIU95633.1 MAG: hypothetical protein COS65_01495 [Armatimonadetes bacterium CG06_land_8_20_14_3_00_66_21]PIW20214.1 MAG: hypothetical protein COW34_02375 [Armatimonadetes bacterium CG17_big_fil_post_rev_8_21_14_2_50_66_6]PIX44278.1 MAG: hypothetical protein COZ57_17745 [Armatimonadetes bacterium CG_4_8_14_3_um_filter_66_20]PIY49825.1 MAG: hypothe
MDDLLYELQQHFRQRGSAAYLVGGAVRDRLLGRPTVEVDLAVDGPALGVAQELADKWQGTAVDLDREHDTARLVLKHRPGRPEIDLKSIAGDLRADLLARDLTVNALALSLEHAARDDWRRFLIDPAGGRADLDRRELRWVTPEAPRRDPLRLIRVVRLSATLEMTIPGDTAARIRELAPTLTQAAPERIRDELFPLLGCPAAADHLVTCQSLGLLDPLWLLVSPEQRGEAAPNWTAGVGLAREVCALADNPGWVAGATRGDVRGWLEQRVAGSRRCREFLVWLALAEGACADTGLPGALTAALNLSRRESRLAASVSATGLRLGSLLCAASVAGSQWLSFFREAGEAAPFCLLTAAARCTADRQDRVAWLFAQYFARTPLARPDPLLTGNDLLGRYPHLSGQQVGRLLRLLGDAHADGLVGTPAEALTFLAGTTLIEEAGEVVH